jgi:heat shock protein HslJ
MLRARGRTILRVRRRASRRFGRTACSAAVSVVLLAAGCGSSSSKATAPTTGPAPSSTSLTTAATTRQSLADTSWDLLSYRANGRVVPAQSAAPAALAFAAAGQLSGTTGCNSFTGTYRSSGSTISITLGAITQVACTGAAAAQERALTQQLGHVNNYAIVETKLELRQGATVLFVYQAGTTRLDGTSWRITGVNNGKGAVVTTSDTERLTAAFSAAGEFNGFGGCNELSGPYTTTGKSGATIGPLVSTRKGCGGTVDQIEAEYSAALGHVANYSISGPTLNLRDAAGATQVTGTRAG